MSNTRKRMGFGLYLLLSAGLAAVLGFVGGGKATQAIAYECYDPIDCSLYFSASSCENCKLPGDDCGYNLTTLYHGAYPEEVGPPYGYSNCVYYDAAPCYGGYLCTPDEEEACEGTNYPKCNQGAIYAIQYWYDEFLCIGGCT